MELSKVKIGKRVEWNSRTKSGRGKIVEVIDGARGSFVKIESKDHPKGAVQVRASQIKPV